MKYLLTLPVLAAVLVSSATYASADTVILASNSGSVTYGGYNPVIGDFNPSPGVGATFNIGTGGIWTSPTGSSSWVSFDPLSCPACGHVNPNGDYYYGSTFIMAAGDTSFVGTLTLMADDTTNVFLNGVELINDGQIGGDGKCSDKQPNCLVPLTITLTGIKAGLNILGFAVEQTGLSAQGLDFSGTVTGTAPIPAIPEPSTLLMLGTGLIGSAGAMFRRMRKS